MYWVYWRGGILRRGGGKIVGTVKGAREGRGSTVYPRGGNDGLTSNHTKAWRCLPKFEKNAPDSQFDSCFLDLLVLIQPSFSVLVVVVVVVLNLFVVLMVVRVGESKLDKVSLLLERFVKRKSHISLVQEKLTKLKNKSVLWQDETIFYHINY